MPKEKFEAFRAYAIKMNEVADDVSDVVDDREFVEEIFHNHGFITWFDDAGNLVKLEQECEKLISQTQLLDAAAPFCKEGGFVGGIGEDLHIWRWVFHSKGVKEESGRIVYDRR